MRQNSDQSFMNIHLAGETVFYNSNILHLGTYDSSKPRATLHACMGSTQGGATRARNILQHGLDWMEGDEFKKALAKDESEGRKRGKEMLERTLRMKRGVGNVGYSLVNH